MSIYYLVRRMIKEYTDSQIYYINKLIMSFSILFPTNQYATSNKSPEEIQKLIIPNDFSPESVLLHIMTKGMSSQMPYLYTYFHRAYQNLLSFICEKASQEQSQNQILIALSFKKIVDEQFEAISIKEMLMIFDTCLQCLNNLQSSSNEEMIKVLETIIKKYINYKELFKRMEEKALELGRPTQPIISRITSCRIISILSKYLNRTLKVQMVDIVKRLSNQNQIQAKKVWLMEIFPKLLHNLDLDFIQLHFQEKIYQTVWDQNQEICRLALQAIFKNVTKFSLEEQSSRIVKLFIDSLTSKSEKTAMMATELIGQVYQKLQNVILKSQSNCIRFWKSLIQLSQSKNQRILNNLIYNLYGILCLSTPHHKVDPLCDIYINLFYSPLSNKLTLSSYFHEMVRLFPSKSNQLREVFMWMFSQILGEEQLTDQAYKIINKIIDHLPDCYYIFLTQVQQENIKEDGSEPPRYLQQKICQNLVKYLNLLINKKISSWINSFYIMIFKCSEYFSHTFIDHTLLPKLYLCLRSKTVNYELVTQIVVKLISRDTNPLLINTYMSKISSQLSKSSKSYQRQIAILFIYHASYYFSLEMFYQYKLGEKYLSFNNDKVFKVKASFIHHLPRIYYFLTREQRLEYSIILTRLGKDQDIQIIRMIEATRFIENESEAKKIICGSTQLREKQKERMTAGNTKRQQTYIGRSNKELRKEEVLKKRTETTKTKNKPLIKEIPKKRLTPLLTKTGSNFHLQKRS